MMQTTITVKITHAEPLTEEERDAVEWNVQLAVTEPGDDDGDTLRGYRIESLDSLEIVSVEKSEIDTRPIIDLERNNAGRLHIGITEIGADGMAVRAYVVSTQPDFTADEVMERRYADLVRLLGDTVRERSAL